MYEKLLTAEFSILDSISKIRNPYLDKIMSAVSFSADKGIIWIALALILLIFKKTRKAGVCVSLALIIDLILVNGIIKPLAARTRPFDVKSGIELIIAAPKDFSFPSGHACASFAASSALFFCCGKWGIISLVFAALVAFSRLYLYVHFPTDVIFGAALGFFLGYVSFFICKKIYSDFPSRIGS